MQTFEEMLASAGGKSLSFKNQPIGASYEGIVRQVDTVQAKDYKTQALEYWPDGQPKMQAVITLQTEYRDPMDPTDDGTRKAYIKGWGEQIKDLKAAIHQAGLETLVPGAGFSITYSGDTPPQPGKDPARRFTFVVSPPPPRPNADVMSLQGQPQGGYGQRPQYQPRPQAYPQQAPQQRQPQAQPQGYQQPQSQGGWQQAPQQQAPQPWPHGDEEPPF